MDRETYDALTASVAKWRNNAAGPADEGTIGAKNCPLCKLFIADDCRGCPVFEVTGKEQCYETPYVDAGLAYYDCRFNGLPESEWRKAAQAEADFLAALVPAGGPDA